MICPYCKNDSLSLDPFYEIRKFVEDYDCQGEMVSPGGREFKFPGKDGRPVTVFVVDQCWWCDLEMLRETEFLLRRSV